VPGSGFLVQWYQEDKGQSTFAKASVDEESHKIKVEEAE